MADGTDLQTGTDNGDSAGFNWSNWSNYETQVFGIDPSTGQLYAGSLPVCAEWRRRTGKYDPARVKLCDETTLGGSDDDGSYAGLICNGSAIGEPLSCSVKNHAYMNKLLLFDPGQDGDAQMLFITSHKSSNHMLNVTLTIAE